MKKKNEQSLAKPLETTPDFLPYLPELLVDLWNLGCSLEQIVEVVGQLNLPPDKTRALDLGCGKGAVSITLAHKFGFRATGIDASKSFLQIADQKAKEYQVPHLCHFKFGDIRDYTQEERDFDLVIYASMGNVLGDYREITNKLRKMVHHSGFMLIDDGFLKDISRIDPEGYKHYFQHETVIEQITSYGDKIVQELIVPDDTIHSINYGYLDSIKRRSEELIATRPELRKEISHYIKNQEVECEIIDKNITGAVWILQRST